MMTELINVFRQWAVDILPIGLVALLIVGMKPVKPISEFNDEYISKDTGKYFRGLFALSVIVHHLAQFTETGLIFRYMTRMGLYFVAFFFFLSGYGLQKSYINKGEEYRKGYLKHRLPAVFVPYFTVVLLYRIVYFLRGDIITLGETLTGLREGQPIVRHSWFIIVIMIFYIVYWLLMTVAGRILPDVSDRADYNKRNLVMILGAVLWHALHIFVCIKLGYGSWWYNSGHLLIVGMIWACYEKEITGFIKKYYKIAATIIPLACVGLQIYKYRFDSFMFIAEPKYILTLLAPVTFVLTIILISMKFRVGNKVLGFVGERAFEIYMMQGIAMYIIDGFLTPQNEIFWCLAALALSVIFGVLLKDLMKLLRRLVLKNQKEKG